MTPQLLSPFFILLYSISIFTIHSSHAARKCEEINIPMCRGIGYNQTSMPNIFHHDSQEEAGLEVHQFWPLVEIQCSEDLRFFLCSMYTPICMDDYPKPLPACRSVCNRAKAGCAPIMSQYGFSWPDRMKCEELPKFGDSENLCMDSKNGEEPTSPSSTLLERFSPVVPLVSNRNENQSKEILNKIRPTKGREQRKKIPSSPTSLDCKCECRPPLIHLEDSLDRRYGNGVETGGLQNCGHPCRSAFFSRGEQEDASQTIFVFSLVCFFCTSLTVMTFLMDCDRFKYPERCIIFISGCYLMVSSGFILRWWFGHEEISCDGLLIRYPATGPGPNSCVIVFLLIYFFGLAASVWWVVLCLTWFLTAGLKWGNEAIGGYSQYFHILALLVPTINSLVILGIGAVDGDPLSGICSVGNTNLEYLKTFVLLPYLASLLLGGVFLIAGFVSLVRLRKAIRQQARSKANRLEKLMIRIIFFSILYAGPATIAVGSVYTEYRDRKDWEHDLTCPCSISTRRPHFWSFVLKHVATLMVGITSGFWLWSPKTLDAWSRCFKRLCCGSRPHPSSRNGGHQLVTSQYISSHRQYKQMPLAQQVVYSSTSHLGSNCNTPGGGQNILAGKVPLAHV